MYEYCMYFGANVIPLVLTAVLFRCGGENCFVDCRSRPNCEFPLFAKATSSRSPLVWTVSRINCTNNRPHWYRTLIRINRVAFATYSAPRSVHMGKCFGFHFDWRQSLSFPLPLDSLDATALKMRLHKYKDAFELINGKRTVNERLSRRLEKRN